jgi:hypothetical protein
LPPSLIINYDKNISQIHDKKMKLLGTEAKGRGYCQFPLRKRELSTFALSKTRTWVGKLPPQQTWRMLLAIINIKGRSFEQMLTGRHAENVAMQSKS